MYILKDTVISLSVAYNLVNRIRQMRAQHVFNRRELTQQTIEKEATEMREPLLLLVGESQFFFPPRQLL